MVNPIRYTGIDRYEINSLDPKSSINHLRK